MARLRPHHRRALLAKAQEVCRLALVSRQANFCLTTGPRQGKVAGVRVEHDEGGGRLFRIELEALGDVDPNRRSIDELVNERVLAQIWTRRVAPRVSLPLILPGACLG